jgi:hypothetical protein
MQHGQHGTAVSWPGKSRAVLLEAAFGTRVWQPGLLLKSEEW